MVNFPKFNSNLKLIMCKKICICNLISIDKPWKNDSYLFEIIFDWNNLSNTIEEVIFSGYDTLLNERNNKNINNNIYGLIERKFPNLHTLNFQSCSDKILSNIYTNIIEPLNKTNKIQTVKISKVPNFQEQDKLKSFGIQCILY
jgi:hypothetical protein